MFDGNNQGYYGQGGFNAYNGLNPQQAQPIKNVLTDEQIKMLQQQGTSFSLGLTEKDVLRAKCTHRQPNGMQDSLVFDSNTGTVRCTICGYEFRPIEADTSIESIADSVTTIVDILQTIKLLFPTLPPKAVGEYFQIIPLIEKIPEFFKVAVKEYAKTNDINAWSYANNNMGAAAMFANLTNAFGNGFMTQQQFAQPQFMNQPMGQPMMNQPMGGSFGFPGASQQPTPAYVPTTAPNYSFTPQQVAPSVSAPATPATPVEPATDVVTTQVNA